MEITEKEIRKLLVDKNVHSVYVYCLECRMFGINTPLNTQCGNCSSMDTITYYDSETIANLINELKEQMNRFLLGIND